MGELIARAIYQGVGGFFLLFVLLPGALIFLGYLIYAVIMAIKEFRKK